jgi:hypothetical protein
MFPALAAYAVPGAYGGEKLLAHYTSPQHAYVRHVALMDWLFPGIAGFESQRRNITCHTEKNKQENKNWKTIAETAEKL